MVPSLVQARPGSLLAEKAGRALYEAWRVNRAVLILAGAYIALVAAAAAIWHFPLHLSLYATIAGGEAIILGMVIAGLLLGGLVVRRPASPMADMAQTWARWRLGKRLCASGPMMIVLPMMFSAYTSLKVQILHLVPYRLDPVLAKLDALVHGGPAYRVYDLLVGTPLATRAIDFSYAFWFFLFNLILLFNDAFIDKPLLRKRYLVSFVLTWAVVGSLGGLLLASVGPCFYGAFIPGADPFAGFMQHLAASVPGLDSIGLQKNLLGESLGGQISMGAGISSMPSMHVALAALMALWGWKVSRPLGLALAAFAVVIQLGTVRLGWHYGIDGYVSVLAAIGLWRLGGLIARWDEAATV